LLRHIDAARSSTLWRGDPSGHEVPPYIDEAPIEVHVSPLKAQQLTEPHPGAERAKKEGILSLAVLA